MTWTKHLHPDGYIQKIEASRSHLPRNRSLRRHANTLTVKIKQRFTCKGIANAQALCILTNAYKRHDKGNQVSKKKIALQLYNQASHCRI